jgi:hypothetical protein
MRYDGSPEGGIPRSDLLLWEWIQLRYLMTCGSDEAFRYRDMRRIKRRMKYLRKKHLRKRGKEENSDGKTVLLPDPPGWEKFNGRRDKTQMKLTNLEYYCTFCGIVHCNDPIQVNIFVACVFACVFVCVYFCS